MDLFPKAKAKFSCTLSFHRKVKMPWPSSTTRWCILYISSPLEQQQDPWPQRWPFKNEWCNTATTQNSLSFVPVSDTLIFHFWPKKAEILSCWWCPPLSSRTGRPSPLYRATLQGQERSELLLTDKVYFFHLCSALRLPVCSCEVVCI